MQILAPLFLLALFVQAIGCVNGGKQPAESSANPLPGRAAAPSPASSPDLSLTLVPRSKKQPEESSANPEPGRAAFSPGSSPDLSLTLVSPSTKGKNKLVVPTAVEEGSDKGKGTAEEDLAIPEDIPNPSPKKQKRFNSAQLAILMKYYADSPYQDENKDKIAQEIGADKNAVLNRRARQKITENQKELDAHKAELNRLRLENFNLRQENQIVRAHNVALEQQVRLQQQQLLHYQQRFGALPYVPAQHIMPLQQQMSLQHQRYLAPPFVPAPHITQLQQRMPPPHYQHQLQGQSPQNVVPSGSRAEPKNDKQPDPRHR